MSQKPSDITVSIVNWNTKEELAACIETVLSQHNIDMDLIVIDNASSDGSADLVREKFADTIRLIENPDNLGFGAAHNQSIRRYTSRYILLLNPDCRLLESDVLSKMVAFMDDNPDVGIIGPKIHNTDGTLQFSARHYPNMIAAVFRHTVFGKLFPNNRFVRDYLLTDWKHDQISDIDWLSGAALLLRREMLDQIGMLDERFFMYCEDVDICRRAHMGGWRVVYYPMVSISHRIGAASDKNAVAMIKQHHRSMLKYFLKYESRSPRVLLTPVVLLGLWLRSRSLIKKASPHK